MVAPRPLRVLLVSSHPVQYAAPLYRRYVAHERLDVTVAYCSLQGAEPGLDRDFGIPVAWDVPLLDGYRWTHPANRSPRPGLGRFWGLLNPGIWTLVRGGRFDIVVCLGYRAASFWIAALAAKLSRSALVFTTDSHDLSARNGSRWKEAAKRTVLPAIFRLSDAVFVPSTRSARFVATLGVPSERVFVTPYVVANEFFASRANGSRRQMARARWRIPPNATVALFVGKLAPWKRPGDLLAALSKAPGVYALFVGEGALRSALEAQAECIGVADRVRWLGFRNQRALPAIYAAADVLVLPSEYEPFGVVVNEAFSCGVPAIVSDACGCLGDLVQPGVTGFAYPVGDIDALADRLRAIASDRARRERMAGAARERIASWGPDRNVRALAEACSTLARVNRA